MSGVGCEKQLSQSRCGYSKSTASLPLITNSSVKLTENKERALKAYNQQMKKLNLNTENKKDVNE